MTDTRSLKLVQQIFKRTNDGLLAWRDIGIDRTFEAEVGGYVVRLSEIDDPEFPDQPDYGLHILRPDGQWIESITNRDLKGFFDEKFEGRNPYALMRDTYKNAHRLALGVDQAMDQLLAFLEDEAEA